MLWGCSGTQIPFRATVCLEQAPNFGEPVKTEDAEERILAVSENVKLVVWQKWR